MAYANIIGRDDVPVREETIDVIRDGLESQSAAMELFREIRVGKKQQRFPVLAALPIAYWVNGDTGLKQTTEMSWANKFVNMEEIAVIVPVPQAVLDDSDFDIWAEARPKVQQAVGRTLDAAVFFGINAPGTFPTNVRAAAIAAGNRVTYATADYPAAEGGFFGALDDLIGTVEDDGFSVTGLAMDRKVKRHFRKARNTDGDRQDRDRVNSSFTELDGEPIVYTMEGMWPTWAADPDGAGAGVATAGVHGFAGDFKNQFILGIRKDITYEVFREGVIQDNTGAIVYNLLQQDMVALRVTFRAGWQVANTINYSQTVEGSRYPAAVLETPAGAAS
jgi:HK97 family phage major capsid protein